MPRNSNATCSKRPLQNDFSHASFTRTASAWMRTVCGQFADFFKPWCDGIPGLSMDRLRARMRSWLRFIHDHGLCRTWNEHDHGQSADAAAVTDWSWTPPGCGLDTALDLSRTAHGYGHGAAICPARLRFHRVHCADTKTCLPAGVGRAPSKTGRLMPCECHRTAGSTGADWIALRMRLDTLNGHFLCWASVSAAPDNL